MSNAPYFSQMSLRCGKCETRWMEWQPNNCHADIWLAAANTHKCPKCWAGSASVFIVTELETEAEAAKETP